MRYPRHSPPIAGAAGARNLPGAVSLPCGDARRASLTADSNSMNTVPDDETRFARALSLSSTLLDSLRICPDPMTVQRRLSLMDCLAPLTFTPALDESGLDDADAAAVATLLMRCLRSGIDDTDWALKAAAIEGCQPLLLLARVADRGVPLTHGYRSPMAGFRSDPSTYTFVDVADLPPFHNPFKCGQASGWRKAAHVRDRWWDRGHEAGVQDLANRQAGDDWLHAQGRVCPLHDLTLDWDDIMSGAAGVLRDVQPWTRVGVLRAVNPSGKEPFDRRTSLLISLFLDPIIWDGKTKAVTNGQHRICGARQAGLKRILTAIE